MDGTQLPEQGRRAFDRRDWRDSYELLLAAYDGNVALEPEDLERLAIAAYLTGRDSESTDSWIRAHQAFLDRGAHADAVRCAFWAGFGLVQRGEMAQGGGWLARAANEVESHRLDCVERGYLLLPEALMAIGSGDLERALTRLNEAADLADRFADRDLAAFAALGRGQVTMQSGQVDAGLRFLDEAMVSVTARETSPIVSGIIYCAVINECHEVFDLRRAREWTAALDRWCAGQPSLVPYQGQCLVHRAQILQLGGEWSEAMMQAQQACERLSEPPHPAIGMAHYEIAELHRLRGELTDAEAAYRRAHAAGRQPHPGLALLRLAEGRVDDAVAAIERAVDEAKDRVTRARLLPAVVEIMLMAGRTHGARAAADELSELATQTEAGLLHAVAAQAAGAVLLAEAEPRRALEQLRFACRAWQGMEAPYETAQVRVLLATAAQALGDTSTAELELDTARSTFEQLGAAPALARLEALMAQPPKSGALPVTPRELEVLRLVAAGKTNREIASELAISERTVERHLGNIFTKLDVPNRAAATAHAYDRGLV